MPVVVRALRSDADGDCAIVALGNYLGVSYGDVLAAAVRSCPRRRPHNSGLTTAEIKRTAQALGTTLRLRRTFDPLLDEGIAGFVRPGVTCKQDEHVAFIKNGLVWDMDSSQVEWAHYCSTGRWRPVSLLVKELP